MTKNEMVSYLRRELDIWKTALSTLAAAPLRHRHNPLAELKLVFTLPAGPPELISRYNVAIDDAARLALRLTSRSPILRTSR